VMVDLIGKPLLRYIVETLGAKGIKEIVMVVGYKKEQIMRYFGDGSRFGVRIEYVEQADPKGGTADAVRCARGKIDTGKSSDKFFVIYGDNVFEPEVIDSMLAKSSSCDGVLCGKPVDEPKKYGILEIENGLVKRIHEKPEHPPSNLANSGLFILPIQIFDAIEHTQLSPRGEYELTDSIQILIDRGLKFGCVKIEGFWIDVGDGERLQKAKEHIKNML